MKFQRITAVTLATIMVLGSAVTAFAADAEGATGEGTAFEHLNKDIISVTLPTDEDVADVFNYYVDPEGVVKAAAKLTDGTDVEGNDDGVYFANESGYSSSSDEVEFEGKNSIDVDVSVTATITAGDNDIELVADEEALAAATGPALLMNLKVGEDTQAILSTGAKAKAQIEGKPDNFEVTVVDQKYAYTVKSDATGWGKTTVQLSGKTNNVDVTTGMTAPTISLIWTIGKHSDSYVSTNTVSAGADATITLSLPEGVAMSGVTITKANDTTVTAQSGTHYTLSGTTLTLKSVSSGWKNVIIKFDDEHTETITVN